MEKGDRIKTLIEEIFCIFHCAKAMEQAVAVSRSSNMLLVGVSFRAEFNNTL
jgi:hypothetical protein